jgi:hypothetical protein
VPGSSSGYRFRGRHRLRGWSALWLIIGLVVLAGVGTGIYFLARGDGSGAASSATSGAAVQGADTAEAVGLFPVPDSSNGTYGYIDKTGNVVIPARYKGAQPFSEGLAPAMLADTWGFIDKTGEFVIEPQFANAWPFSDGLALVLLKDSTAGYIDKTGKFVIQAQGMYAEPFSEGLALMATNAKYGHFDTSGKLVIKPHLNYADSFSGGLAAAKGEGGYGYIDITGPSSSSRSSTGHIASPRGSRSCHVWTTVSRNAAT